MNVREYARRAEIMLPSGQRLKAFGKRVIAQSHVDAQASRNFHTDSLSLLRESCELGVEVFQQEARVGEVIPGCVRGKAGEVL